MTDDILDEPYTDMMRKFKTYRAVDKVIETTPILAYPILDEKGGVLASEASGKALRELYGLTGQDVAEVVAGELEPHLPDKVVRDTLEGSVGPLVDINDLLNRGKDNG